MNEPPKDPLPGITKAGRLLIFLTLVFTGFLLYLEVEWLLEHGPSGRYPLAFLLVIAAPVSLVFFLLGKVVLHLLGFPFEHEIETEEPDEEEPEQLPPSDEDN